VQRVPQVPRDSCRRVIIAARGRWQLSEAAELLRDQNFSPNLGAVLRKLKPTRQVECIELMVSANNITVAYAQALVAATPSNMLVGEVKPRKLAGISADQMAKRRHVGS
jgi:hypothetical protein